MAKDNKNRKERKKSAEATVEVAAPQEAAPQVTMAPKEPVKAEAPKIDFDAWFIMRKSKIPSHHHKEIMKADFKGRGLGQCESIEDFDAALRKYGVKLA